MCCLFNLHIAQLIAPASPTPSIKASHNTSNGSINLSAITVNLSSDLVFARLQLFLNIFKQGAFPFEKPEDEALQVTY
jgi:hypothetical protein